MGFPYGHEGTSEVEQGRVRTYEEKDDEEGKGIVRRSTSGKGEGKIEGDTTGEKGIKVCETEGLRAVVLSEY